jgi:alginate O-acetyltransferase complex protein AlgI
MLFPTPTFAIFLLVVLPLSWALMARQPLWRPFMLAASYVFYAWWDWRFVFLLASSTIVNHVLAVAIFRAGGQRLRRAYLVAAISYDLGVLAYVKYAGFFVSSAENFLTRLGIAEASSVVHVALPVGISFYTFMAISYVVDTYRGELEPATSRGSPSSSPSSRTSSQARSSARASCCRSSSGLATRAAWTRRAPIT